MLDANLVQVVLVGQGFARTRPFNERTGKGRAFAIFTRLNKTV
jgi:hypothetical protein